MRLRLALALSAFPVALASYLVGCSSDLPIEDLCGWIGNENNCYREFAENVGSTCGRPGQGSAPLGYFLARDKLDVCILAEGGQVIFDPPLDVAQFPVDKASFAFLDDQGYVCGAAAIAPDGAMAISIASKPPVPDGGTCESADGGAGGSGGSAGGPPGSELCGGDFSIKPVTERELVDARCPGGEPHHFNRLQLSKCPEYDQLFPRAEFESNPGSIGIDGFVKFRILYPPPAGALKDANPDVVEYFNCVIPGGSPTCANGFQDENEADVDCGAICPTKCGVAKKCHVPIDCVTLTCELDEMTGFRVCQKNPNCANMKKDVGEGDVDCGLVCENACALGKTCNVNGDCGNSSDVVCTPDAAGQKVCTAVVMP